MEREKLIHRIFFSIFYTIILLWFIFNGIIAHLTEKNQIFFSEGVKFECSENWYDDDGNKFNIKDLKFSKEDLGKKHTVHFQIPSDIELTDNYAICFFSRGMDFNVYMQATENSVYDDPEEYGKQYFYEYTQDSAGMAGPDIGLKMQIIPIYWTDIGNEVSFEIIPTATTVCFTDVTIEESQSFVFSMLRSRIIAVVESLVIVFFGIATLLYTLLTPGIDEQRKTGHFALGALSIASGLLFVLETRVIQILTGQPELYTAMTYLLMLIIGFALAVLVDSYSEAPHKRFSNLVGILTIALIAAEFWVNYEGYASYHTMLPIAIAIILFDFLMAINIMIKDIVYVKNNPGISAAYPVYTGVILTMISLVADLFIYLYYNDRITDRAAISRVCYLFMIVILIVRALQLAVRRDKKAMMAEVYRKQARTDAMTGLYNRGAFMEREIELTGKLLAECRGGNCNFRFVVMSLDLNNLKKVNDSIGHAMGDKYIKNGAKIISTAVGDDGEIYRIGGDEFMVLIFGKNPEALYQEVAARLKKGVETYNRYNPSEIDLSVAYGHAICESDGFCSIYDAEKESDIEMYACKKAMKEGRGKIQHINRKFG
ncbi:MAG: GGDEF domain-containing protein [Lachnospiraceae bacterium]|nr:GGDEF domain-containing protein [Lachnospiraceae bacterium]